MKKILLFFGLLFLLPISHSYAAAGDNCSVNIVSTGLNGSITSSQNWRDIMYVRGDDGYLWQRAIISSQSDGIQLEDGEPIEIYGLAEPYSAVQFFVFTRVDNNPDDANDLGIQKPGNGDGICFEMDAADVSGRFFISIALDFLWGNLGNDQVIDAFYRTDMTWNQFLGSQSKTNQNIFVGTHVDPRIVRLGGAGVAPPNCTQLCDTGMVEAVNLRPDTISPPELLGTNFDDVGSSSVTVGRFPDQHTYYTTSSVGAGSVEDLRWVSQKAILMEVMKRRLLGMVSVGGTVPGLPVINSDALEGALDETDASSDQTKTLAQNIHGLMTAPPFILGTSPVTDPLPEPPPPPPPPLGTSRSEALEYLNPIFVLDSDLKKDELLEEIIPAQISNLDDWADDLVRLINFWTGSTEINECLLFDDFSVIKNYEWHGDSGNKGDGLVQCGYEYVTGSTPLLLLHIDGDVTLEPDFSGATLIASDKWFDALEKWVFSSEKPKRIQYNYNLSEPFSGSYIAESCFQKEDVSDFAKHLSGELDLLDSEKEAIITELSSVLRLSKNFVRLRLADPNDIAEHISWKANGEPLDVLQLFFDVQEGGCGAKDFGSFDALPVSIDRDAFEVGVVDE